jgi:hypothetical protein
MRCGSMQHSATLVTPERLPPDDAAVESEGRAPMIAGGGVALVPPRTAP